MDHSNNNKSMKTERSESWPEHQPATIRTNGSKVLQSGHNCIIPSIPIHHPSITQGYRASILTVSISNKLKTINKVFWEELIVYSPLIPHGLHTSDAFISSSFVVHVFLGKVTFFAG
jgi:hypothetical protein